MKSSGFNVSGIVTIRPITKVIRRVCLIFLFMYIKLFFVYSFETNGRSAWDIARVKNEGRSINGIM